MMETYYRKYRPSSFSEVIGQKHIIDVLKSQVASSNVGNSYIFIGPRGTGKTSIARIFAKSINCLDLQKGDVCNKCKNCKMFLDGKSLDIVEIDAASNRSIEDIKLLKEKINFAPISFTKKVYIIDEVHMLSKDAFNALLKTLEEPPTYVVFILATTEGQKVPQTILSRCQRFDFKLANLSELKSMIKEIALKEKKEVTEETIELVAELGKGSYRDSLTILQKLLSHQNTNLIELEDAHKILGLSGFANIVKLFEQIYTNDFENSLELSKTLMQEGISPNQIVSQLIRYIQKVLVLSKFNSKRVYSILESLFSLEKRMKYTDFDNVAFELFLYQVTKEGEKYLKGKEDKKVEGDKKEVKKDEPKERIEEIKKEEKEEKEIEKVEENLPKESWNTLLSEIRKESSMLFGSLSSSRIVKEGGDFVIYVKSKFIKDRIENSKSKKIIDTCMDKVFSSSPKYSVKVLEKSDFEDDNKSDIVRDIFNELLV